MGIKEAFVTATLEEKYGTGEYIHIFTREKDIDWQIASWCSYRFDEYSCGNKYLHKLIHKKDEDVLRAYIADPTRPIEYAEVGQFDEPKWVTLQTGFIASYSEDVRYRCYHDTKSKYPMFKRNKDNEIYTVNEYGNGHIVLGRELDNRYIKVPYEWETVEFDRKAGFFDMQPVWWVYADYSRALVYYDKSKHLLLSNNIRIEPVTRQQLRALPFIWDNYLRAVLHKQVCEHRHNTTTKNSETQPPISVGDGETFLSMNKF